MGFYTPEEEKKRLEYIPPIRQQILKHLDDLRKKIETNENFPHGEQDIDSLVRIDDNIEECLNNWYY